MSELLFLTWLSHLRRAGMSKPDPPHNPVFSLILPSYPYVSSLPTFSPIFSRTLRVQVRVPQSFLCSPLSLPLLAVPLFFGPGAAFSSTPFADSEQCASVRALVTSSWEDHLQTHTKSYNLLNTPPFCCPSGLTLSPLTVYDCVKVCL